MAVASKADKVRLEQAWLGMFCSALSGYRPDEDSFPQRLTEDEADERDELYINDAINFAENAADNGLRTFVDTFGPKVGGVYTSPRDRGEDEDD